VAARHWWYNSGYTSAPVRLPSSERLRNGLKGKFLVRPAAIVDVAGATEEVLYSCSFCPRSRVSPALLGSPQMLRYRRRWCCLVQSTCSATFVGHCEARTGSVVGWFSFAGAAAETLYFSTCCPGPERVALRDAATTLGILSCGRGTNNVPLLCSQESTERLVYSWSSRPAASESSAPKGLPRKLPMLVAPFALLLGCIGFRQG